jgi:hypothetical protein
MSAVGKRAKAAGRRVRILRWIFVLLGLTPGARIEMVAIQQVPSREFKSQ